MITPAAAYGFSAIDLGPVVDLRGPLDWLKAIRPANYSGYLDEVAEVVLAQYVLARAIHIHDIFHPIG